MVNKCNYEWPQASAWDNYSTQDKVGGTTQRVDPLVYLSKLEQVVQFTGLGLFYTADGLLTTLNRDEFLTGERLARWALIINTVNAI